MVFSSVEIWWNVRNKYGETRRWQLCHRWWHGLWHRHRIEPFSKITIILEQGEWSIAKDIGPFFRRCNARHRQTFYDLVNVFVFDIGSICIHRKELLRQFTSIKNTGQNLTLKQMFEISEKLMLEQSDEIFWSVSNQLGKFSMKKITCGQWWRSHQSLACKGLCILRFCVMSWKGESEPNIKFCVGTAVGLVQWFITKQNLGHNWRRTDGIRVEYFPGCTTLHVDKVQEFMNKMSEPEQFQVRIIFMSMFNDIIWWSTDNEQECIANAPFVSEIAKNQQDVGHSSDLRQKRSGILLATKDHEENGTESLKWWWSNSEKADTQSSEPRVHCLEKRSKAKEVENYQHTSVPMGIRLKLFFRTIISVTQLNIYGAVSDVCEECSTCQTRTRRPEMAGQSDPLFEPAKLLIWHPDLRLRFLHKKMYCKSPRNECEGFHNKIDW